MSAPTAPAAGSSLPGCRRVSDVRGVLTLASRLFGLTQDRLLNLVRTRLP